MTYKILDLFCCGGGAGFGYEQAGFDVTGVDIDPQPNHRGKFHQADAFAFLAEHAHEYDAIHASPPCQEYSMATRQYRNEGKWYPDLVGPTRDALIATGLPYVIENVPGAPLLNPTTLCGAMFGMRTYRHRLFETNFPVTFIPHPIHNHRSAKMGRRPADGEFIQYVGHFSGVKMVRDMTGLHWLTRDQLAQSIPPQYTRFIGMELLKHLMYDQSPGDVSPVDHQAPILQLGGVYMEHSHERFDN